MICRSHAHDGRRHRPDRAPPPVDTPRREDRLSAVPTASTEFPNRAAVCYGAVTDQTLRAAAEAVSGNGAWQPCGKLASVRAEPSPLQG